MSKVKVKVNGVEVIEVIVQNGNESFWTIIKQSLKATIAIGILIVLVNTFISLQF